MEEAAPGGETAGPGVATTTACIGGSTGGSIIAEAGISGVDTAGICRGTIAAGTAGADFCMRVLRSVFNSLHHPWNVASEWLTRVCMMERDASALS